MSYASDGLSLVADVGGTNTRVALARRGQVLPDSIRRFTNREFGGIEKVLQAFTSQTTQTDTPPVAACVAIAGPVRAGHGRLTNLDWSIDKATLAQATGARIPSILNDLQAQGHALSLLPKDAVRTVMEGAEPIPNGVRLVIGVGTGFNAAVVYDTEDGLLVPPSEAGHANLPIRREEELRLIRHVEMDQGFAAVEDVLSGRGLERVYAWLAQEAGTQKTATAAQIMEACQHHRDPLAHQAGKCFSRLWGTVAGNLALIHLPFGGIYLVGGVSRAFQPYLSGYGFCEAFRDKGRFSQFMENFPTHVVVDDYAALSGCAAHLERLMRKSL